MFKNHLHTFTFTVSVVLRAIFGHLPLPPPSPDPQATVSSFGRLAVSSPRLFAAGDTVFWYNIYFLCLFTIFYPTFSCFRYFNIFDTVFSFFYNFPYIFFLQYFPPFFTLFFLFFQNFHFFQYIFFDTSFFFKKIFSTLFFYTSLSRLSVQYILILRRFIYSSLHGSLSYSI